MKTAISIPDQDFQAAEKLAKRLNMSRSQLYQTAIVTFVAQHSEDRVTEALNEIYGLGDNNSKLPEDVKRMQSQSLRRDDW